MVWRSFGSKGAIRRKAWMKPRSSIWSASSSTRKRVSFSRTALRSSRSISRPGVATRISVPFCNICDWANSDRPPTTRPMRGRSLPAASPCNASTICMASSRVGARTSACAVLGAARSAPITPCRIGRPNAAVLPVPVCARPRTSRPFSAWGMALS